VPMMYSSRADAEAGGLIGYGVDPLESYRRAASYVDKILKGTKPGDLPVQQPTKLDLAVNLKTAATLNIKIPQTVLVQPHHFIESFRQGLRELGYVEGQNIAIEYRFAEGRPERLPALAAELVRLKVDVIVAGGPPAPGAAKQATGTIPIVFAVAADPVAEGLV